MNRTIITSFNDEFNIETLSISSYYFFSLVSPYPVVPPPKKVVV